MVQTIFSLSRQESVGGGLNGNCVTLNTITIATGGEVLIIILINAELSCDDYYDYLIYSRAATTQEIKVSVSPNHASTTHTCNTGTRDYTCARSGH